MKLFELVAELALDASGFESDTKKASSLANKMASSVGGSVKATTIALGNLMADATRKSIDVAKGLGTLGLSYNRQMETYQVNFQTMLNGSAEAAGRLTDELESMAASTPFAMTDLADATQTLLAFGIESESVIKTLGTLGDISMGDAQKLNSLTLAFAQATSSGKLMGQDLMQMINAGFNPLETIASRTGASIGDLKEYMSSGKASRELKKQMREAQREVKKMGDEASDSAKMLAQMAKEGGISADLLGQIFAIETSPGGKFYQAMLNASKTMDGMLSTLKDDSTALVGRVFEPIAEWMSDDLLPRAIEIVGELSKAYDEGGLSSMVGKATGILSGYFEEWGSMAYDAGADILANIYNALTGQSATGEDIKGVLSGIFSAGTTAAESLVKTGGEILRNIQSAINGDPQSKSEIIGSLSSLFDAGVDGAVGLVTTASTLLADIYASITGDSESASKISTYMAEIFKGSGTVITGLKDTALGVLQWILDNGEALSPIASGLGISLGILAMGANPLGAALGAAALGIAALSTDWDKFEDDAPHLIEQFEKLTGLEFEDFKAGVEGVRESLAALGEWYTQNQTIIGAILAAVGGLAMMGGHPVVGVGLMTAGVSMFGNNVPQEIQQCSQYVEQTVQDLGPAGQAFVSNPDSFVDYGAIFRMFTGGWGNNQTDTDEYGQTTPDGKSTEEDDDDQSAMLESLKAALDNMPDNISAALAGINFSVNLNAAGMANALTPYISANLARSSRNSG